MAAGDVTEGGFRARAGTLTLMYVASSVSREYLLRMLVEGLLGIKRDEAEAEAELAREEEGTLDLGELVEVDPDYPGGGVAAAGEGEEEIDEYDDEYVLDDDDPDPPPGARIILGPEAQMRVSSRGSEMLYVAEIMRRWLARAPAGPLELGNIESGRVLAALVFSWSSTAVHVLAARPLTFEELVAAVPTVSRQVLTEQAEMMVGAGLVTVVEEDGETRYAVTDWCRESIAPLAAAARWERHYPEADTLPPDSLDVGTAFLLTLPLLKLPPTLQGTCRLGVVVDGPDGPSLVGVTARVEGGQVASIQQGLDHAADASATGSVLDWLDTLVKPELSQIETGGDPRLAEELIRALHQSLFPSAGK